MHPIFLFSVLAVEQQSIPWDNVTMALGPESGLVFGGVRQVVPGDVIADRDFFVSPYSPYAAYVTSPVVEDRPGNVVPETDTDLQMPWYEVVDLRNGQSWKLNFAGQAISALSWATNGRILFVFTTTESTPNRIVSHQVFAHDLVRRSSEPVTMPNALATDEGVSFSGAGYRENGGFPIIATNSGKFKGPIWLAVPSPASGLSWIPWTAPSHGVYGEWRRDKRGYFVCFPPGTSKSYTLDPVTKKVTEAPADQVALLESRAPEGMAMMQVYTPIGVSDTKAALSSLWITAEGKADALVAPEAESYQVADNWTWVAYSARGGLYVRNMQGVERDFILKQREAIERTKALSRVKQIGTALQIYAADYDGGVPPAGSVRDALEPYLKNSGMFDGFVYTFKGNNLNNVDNPSQAEVGYIPVPGGRAVVFADGHAKILPNPA